MIQSRIRMGFRQVSGWPMLRCGYCSGGQDRYDDQGCDCRLGTGRREFGSGYCRVADYREGGDCYKGRYDRWDEGHRAPRMITLRMIIDMMTEPPTPNPKLNLKPWDIPKEDASFASTSQ